MKFILSAVLLLSAFLYNAQSVEELKSQLESTSGQQKAQVLVQLSNAIISTDEKAALDYAKDAIELSDGNENLLAPANILVAQASEKLKKHNDAITYGEEAAKLYKNKDEKNYAMAQSIVGDGYKAKGDSKKAISAYQEAYSTYKSLGKDNSLAYTASAIGIAYNNLKKYKEAEQWLEKSSEHYEDAGKYTQSVNSLKTVGAIWANYGNYDKAEDALNEALTKAKTLGASTHQIESDLELLANNKAADNDKSEFETEQDKIQEVTLENIKSENSKTLAEIESLSEEMQLAELKIKAAQDEATLNFLKKEQAEDQAELAKLEQQKAQQEADLAKLKEKEEQQKKWRLVWIAMGVGALALFAIIMFLNTQKKNKLLKTRNEEILAQKNEITAQKSKIEKQSEDIHQSIEYATRIQRTMLPSVASFSSLFPESFAFLKPKDNVSGDFFWFQEIGNEIILVAADCTGHGVPGAFMSIIFSNILDKVVKEQGITTPSEILEGICGILTAKLMERNVLSSEFKDGMDVAIVNLNKDQQKIQFSGARNGMYYIDKENNLVEVKATRRSVGMITNQITKPFENQSLSTDQMDRFFLFSDGFPDQRGGKEEKKFFYKPFRSLLLDTAKLDADQALHKLETTFEEWKGSHEQFDDVMVISVKV